MAREILITELIARPGAGGFVALGGFFYEFAPMETQTPANIGRTRIVPTPAEMLPPMWTVLGLLHIDELTALNEGTAVFHTFDVGITEAMMEAPAQAVALLRAARLQKDPRPGFIRRYSFTGTRVNS